MKITIHHTLAFVVTIGVALGLASTSAAQTVSAEANFSVSARALAAIQVPTAAIELRAAGVPEPEVQTAFVAVHEHHIPAPEVHLMLTHSVRHVRVHGVIPDFGHFVEIRLDDGYRGPRLYKEIRIAHKHPGHGPPPHAKAYGHSKIKVKGPKHHGHGRVDVHVHGPHIPRPPSAHVNVHLHGGGPAHHSVKVKGGGGHKVKFKGGGGHKVKFKAKGGRGKH